MSFNLFGTSREPEANAQSVDNAEALAAKETAAEKNTPIKESAADKKGAAEKESSVAEKVETDSRKERIKQESNSKVECRNPNCKEPLLNHYSGEFDGEGEPLISGMYCLNCGFNFLYFDKFEKEEKKAEGELNWGFGFALLVGMLFTVIAIKGEQEGRFFNDEPTRTTEQRDDLRSPQTEVFSTDSAPVRVLNSAEPFEVDNN